jgi:hypothetical protein
VQLPAETHEHEMRGIVRVSACCTIGSVASRSLGVTRSYVPAAAAVALLVVAVSAPAGPVPDRLDRFRELASDRLSAAQVLDAEAAADAYREAYALLDEEIVESLGTGSVFASIGFLQERLDAFSDAWGGAAVRLIRLGKFTVGVFQLGERANANSVRVYGRMRDEAALLTTLVREGKPTLYPLPPGAGGTVQFLVAWDGAQSGRGNRPLRLDVARQHGDGVQVVWSTANVYPEGLVARAYTVRGTDLRIRYELHYAGWVPGCEGQTEQEDVYRLSSASGVYGRVTQRQFDTWHRDLHASASRFFSALSSGDRRTVSTFVADPKVRDRLPARLDAEPVCDNAGGAKGEPVAVAATDGQGAPWAVTFQRDGARWRVTTAAPVIP